MAVIRSLFYQLAAYIGSVFHNVAVKLTVASKIANTIVFAKSYKCKLGKMLNKVPASFPAFRELLISIRARYSRWELERRI